MKNTIEYYENLLAKLDGEEKAIKAGYNRARLECSNGTGNPGKAAGEYSQAFSLARLTKA